MELDSRFDFSDAVDPYYIGVFDETSDEDLLAFINQEPRLIGFRLKQLEYAYEQIQERGLLIEHPITLQERSDDWLAARRGEIRSELSILSKKEEALQEERSQIDIEFMRRFSERGTSGTRTSLYTVTMREDDNYPEVYDRTEFENYILNTQKIHLFQKRLSMSAIQEELAALKEEYNNYIEELERSSNKEATAIQIYKAIYSEKEGDSDYLQNKLNILIETGTLVDTLVQELKDITSIPGIKLVKKLTINSKKRG